MNDTVSFIIVNASGREHLAVLLESLATLDYPNELFDIWVVDNHSQDSSVEWLRQAHPSVKVICNSTNEGFARPNNLVASKTNAKWLALVNNDMRLDSNWLKNLLEVAQTQSCDCVASKILSWDGKHLDFDGSALAFSGHGLQPRFGHKAENAKSDESYAVPFACGGAMLVRRNTFIEIGGFDENYFAYYEDVDLGWRLWLYGHEVWFAPRAIAYHRHNATSKKAPSFQKQVLMERNALYTVLKNYNDENLARVLPAVFLLANKRFLTRSNIDCGEFRFALPDKPSNTESLWQKAFRVISQKGPHALWHKALLKGTQALTKSLKKPASEGYLQLERDVFAQAVAYGEVADRMEALMERRREIQCHRRRPDSEILPLFGTPFLPIEEGRDYQATQTSLIQALELEQLFS